MAELPRRVLGKNILTQKPTYKYSTLTGSRFGLWGLNERTRQVFIKQESIDKKRAVKLVNQAFPYVKLKLNGFTSIRGEKSPYDGDIIYWSKRKNLLYDGYTEKALNKQSHKCGYCGLHFIDSEKIELHHIDGNHSNWLYKNLQAIHRSCHHYIHMSKNRKDTRFSGAG